MTFNGQRLKMARIYRNINIAELADIIGVSKQAISQFENNLIKPKLEAELSIISTLKFPRSFFYQEDDEIKINKTFFRALSSTTAIDKKTQEIKTKMIVQIYNFLCEYLDLPCVNLPKIDDKKDIELVAETVRDYWGIGVQPVPNMVNLLERNGIIVSAFDVDSDKIDAFTQIHDLNSCRQYCVVVGNNKKSAVRRNFDIAHELGHIILHSDIDNLDELSTDDLRELENEANQFAAAFLMPKNTFYAELENVIDLISYIELKKKWHVSIAAMLIRAKELGRISILEYQKMMKSMSYRKWRIQEPLDSELKVSSPTLFSSAIEVLFENNIMTPQSFMSLLSKYGLSINSDEVEKLLSLPNNMLSENSLQTIELKNVIDIK